MVISLISFGLGMMTCGIGFIGSPVGAIIGFRDLQNIKDGQADPTNKGLAITGIVLGVVGTLMLLGIVGLIAFSVLAGA